MRKFRNGVVICLCGVALSSCGGGLYRPAAASLGKSFAAMNTTLGSTLEDYPTQFRSAYLDQYVPTDAAALAQNPSSLLCQPVHASVLAEHLANDIGVSSAALTATAGESPEGFSELLGDTIAGQTITGSEEDATAAAVAARDKCGADLRNLVAAREAFTSSSGLEFGGAIGGVLALWDLLKPVAKGALGFVNQQQRETAIREFIVRESPSLRAKVKKLAEFSKRRADYERAFAAAEFAKAAQEGLSDGLLDKDERSALLTAGEAYDEVRGQDPSGAYLEVEKSLGRLQNVASGRYNREDLAAAIGSLGKSISGLNSVRQKITELEKGGDKHQALKDALDKIRGKTALPPTEGS